jgi:hypothetical protein
MAVHLTLGLCSGLNVRVTESDWDAEGSITGNDAIKCPLDANAHWMRTFRTRITELPTQNAQCDGFHVCCCDFFAGKIACNLNMHQLLMVLLTAENSEEELDDEKLEGFGWDLQCGSLFLRI